MFLLVLARRQPESVAVLNALNTGMSHVAVLAKNSTGRESSELL